MGFKLEHIATQTQEKKSVNLDQLLKTELNFGKKAFSNKKKEAFYTELSVLLKAGISLKDALVLLANEQKKGKLHHLFNGIIDTIIAGKSFSESILSNPQFTEYEYYSIKIGEETGTLQKVSHELGLFFRRRNEQRRTVASALSYPVVVLLTALLAIVFMLKYVVPMFADIFSQNKVELPGLTKFIMKGSSLFQSYFGLILIFILVLVVVKIVVAKTPWYKKWKSKVILRIPFIGELIRKMYIGQFTQAISLLMSAKVPVLSSIQLTNKMIDFHPLRKALSQVENDILQGENLSLSLSHHRIFDAKMISLLKVAEETNQNEFIFERLTAQYNEEIQYQSKLLSTVLEPVIIVFLGAVVAIILIAMYLPMFTLSSVLG